MAEYVVYVNVDQLRTGMETAVANAFSQIGFKRATRRDKAESPLKTLLFVGVSSYSEGQLARHLENTLRLQMMCDIHVIVFQMQKLRSRPVVPFVAIRSGA